jgi:RIO-like serine/threonine protein kinase
LEFQLKTELVVEEEHDSIPKLTEDEAKVLNYLNEEDPQIRYQQNIVDNSRRDRKTIGLCLQKLMKLGFVSRPEGKKKGYVITSQGQEYLKEHFCA